MEIGLVGIWYLLFVGVFLPYLVVKSALALRTGVALPSKRRQFVTTIITLAILMGIAVFTAHREWIDLLEPGRLTPEALATALGLLVLALVTLMLRWRLGSEEENRRIMRTRPQKPSELGPWFVTSLAAAVAEECVYRGVLFTLLYRLTESWWIAALLSILVFGVSHATQGWGRAATIGFLALGFHVLVWQTGSLYLAMAVHFLYDFVAGILYLRLGRAVAPGMGESRAPSGGHPA